MHYTRRLELIIVLHDFQFSIHTNPQLYYTTETQVPQCQSTKQKLKKLTTTSRREKSNNIHIPHPASREQYRITRRGVKDIKTRQHDSALEQAIAARRSIRNRTTRKTTRHRVIEAQRARRKKAARPAGPAHNRVLPSLSDATLSSWCRAQLSRTIILRVLSFLVDRGTPLRPAAYIIYVVHFSCWCAARLVCVNWHTTREWLFLIAGARCGECDLIVVRWVGFFRVLIFCWLRLEIKVGLVLKSTWNTEIHPWWKFVHDEMKRGKWPITSDFYWDGRKMASHLPRFV